MLQPGRPNVIVIVWESFTEKATHATINNRQVTPRFNELKKEGIYFSHMYASGDRTDKGLAAVLSGYPALNNFSIIHQPAKSAKLGSLGHYFKQMGYRNLFYYGGEPEFANIKSYILQSQYDQIVEKSDFPSSKLNSKWGAHDGAVAEKISNDLSGMQQPFFATWLTLTSHEPFETPDQPVFPGHDIPTRFLNSIHYTDEVLYRFVRNCQQQPWWKNTVMVIVADHGHPLPEPSTRLDNFKIPMLWLGGALKQVGQEVDEVGSQLDIATTLARQINDPGRYFPFSKNLFSSGYRPWAYFSFNDGFGMVQSGKALVFDNIGKQVITRQGPVTGLDIEMGKAMQQFCYQDYLNK
jgi:phosphoglycerol transferase MdoB-like AlkP superfamily enzyme